jgi:hypothetical protein
MWRAIDETYDISIDGKARNRKTGRILKPFMVGNYHSVSIGAGNKRYIHHLVAAAFLPTPTELCVIDHIDRDKHNNHACNLRWVSRRENSINRVMEVRPRSTNKTGEHHIKRIMGDRQVTPSYIVVIRSLLWGNHYKCFNNMSDAVKFRDEVINGLQAEESPKP